MVSLGCTSIFMNWAGCTAPSIGKRKRQRFGKLSFESYERCSAFQQDIQPPNGYLKSPRLTSPYPGCHVDYIGPASKTGDSQIELFKKFLHDAMLVGDSSQMRQAITDILGDESTLHVVPWTDCRATSSTRRTWKSTSWRSTQHESVQTVAIWCITFHRIRRWHRYPQQVSKLLSTV